MTKRTIGLPPPVRASAVCIGGPLDGKRYMVSIGDGKAFAPDDAEWKKHGATYRCEYLSIDSFNYHVIIHDGLGTVAAVGRLLEAYGDHGTLKEREAQLREFVKTVSRDVIEYGRYGAGQPTQLAEDAKALLK